MVWPRPGIRCRQIGHATVISLLKMRSALPRLEQTPCGMVMMFAADQRPEPMRVVLTTGPVTRVNMPNPKSLWATGQAVLTGQGQHPVRVAARRIKNSQMV